MKKVLIIFAMTFIVISSSSQDIIRPTIVAGDLSIAGQDTTGEMLYYDLTTDSWKTTLFSTLVGDTSKILYAYDTIPSTASYKISTRYDLDTTRSNVWTALGVRCLEAVFGTAIGTGLTLDGTTLKTHASLQSIAGLTETNGGLLYGTADNTYAWLGAGAEGTLLMGNGAGAPSWLGAGTSGQFLLAAGAADPVWTTQADLTALEALASTGLVARTGAATYSERTITGTASEVEVTNGDGVSGNPTIGLPDEVEIVDLKADTVDWALPNLLTNTDFLVNSQATVSDYSDGYQDALHPTSTCTDPDDDQDNTTEWTPAESAVLTSDAGGQTGNRLTITENGANNPLAFNNSSGIVKGVLYRFTFYVKQGTESTYQAYVTDGVVNYGEDGGAEATDSWVQHTYYFVAQNTDDSATIRLIQVATSGAGTDIMFDDVSLSEVSQSYISTNNKAPDGWIKSNGLDIYTVDDPDSLPVGAVRGLRLVPGAINLLFKYGGFDQLPLIKKFAGRTITLSCWVKTATASHVRVRISDGSDYYSSFHTGGDTWELLSVTTTMSTAATAAEFVVILSNSTGQVLITEPQLSYGNSIGTYQPFSGMVWLDDQITFNDYSNVTISADISDVNIVEQSLGRIASGGKSIFISMRGKCANPDKYLGLNAAWDNPVSFYSQVANILNKASGFIKLINDFFDIQRSDTFTIVKLYVSGIEY